MKLIISLMILFKFTSVLAGVNLLDTANQQVIEEMLEVEEDIIGVDLVVAGGYEDGPFYSRWGHAFLVLINKNEKHYYNNIALTFFADTSGAKDSVMKTYLKGIRGKFKLTMELDYFYYFWQQYLIGEGRPLKRIMIPLTSISKRNLIGKIKEYFTKPEILGQYEFLSRNCVIAATELLKDAGVPIEGHPVIPLNAADYFQKNNVTQVPVKQIETAPVELKKIDKFLKDKKITKVGQINFELLDSMVIQFGIDEIWKFINLNSSLSIKFGHQFEKKYQKELEPYTLNNSFKTMSELYELCESSECGSKYLDQLRKSLSDTDFRDNLFWRHQQLSRIELDNPYTKHARLVFEEFKSLGHQEVLLETDKNFFSFSVEKVEGEQVYLNVCLSETMMGNHCFESSRDDDYIEFQEIKVSLKKMGKILYLNERACFDGLKRKFTSNCGLVKEGHALKLVGY
ncbi:MAG: DUF4105 domain-containing protein [Bacteriovoracaceae bacterium]